MVPYQYVEVTKEFARGLASSILQGESAVILGHRYAGKTFLLDQIKRLIEDTPGQLVMHVSLYRDTGIWTEREAYQVFRSALPPGVRTPAEEDQSERKFYAPIDWVCDSKPQPIIVFASNVDAMGHTLARRFLQAMRTRVLQRQLVVVLTGEVDLTELVHGPTSEFNCSQQYYLQGFDLELFGQLVSGLVRARSIDLVSPPDAVQVLWELARGDYGVVDAILGNIVEQRVLSFDWDCKPINSAELREAASGLIRRGPAASILLHRAAEIISWEPGCWDLLQRLLSGRPLDSATLDNTPGPLEIAGVTKCVEGSRTFASPFMSQFCKVHYTDSRLGDLYARNGDWEQAFRCWTRASSDPILRPTDLDDRPVAASLVRTLCTSFHSSALHGPGAVSDLFSKGCRYVLGLKTVIFWRRSETWRVSKELGFPACQEDCAKVARCLPVNDSLGRGLFPMPDPYGEASVAAALDVLAPDRAAAVVVGDISGLQPISRERARLVDVLLNHFIDAYGTAVRTERSKQRVEVRDKHIDVIDAIIDALGSKVLDVGHALAYAARGLRGIGYRRVLVCLVDSKREKIVGVIDSSDDPSVDVAKMTSWPLTDPMADIQPYVVMTKKAIVVPDASKEPLTNKDVVRDARLRAVAIIPMMDRIGQVVGTVHVERIDGRVPSGEEVEDLKLFGRQFATLIEQSERMNYLQRTVEKTPDPVVIVDSSKRLRYANIQASEIFGMPTGWGRTRSVRTDRII